MKKRMPIISSALRRYSLLGTAFLACLLGVMGIYMNARLSLAVEREFARGGQDIVTAVADAHHIQLLNMRNTVNQMAASAEFFPFRLQDNPVKAMNVITRLREFGLVNQFYQTIILRYGHDDFAYASGTSIEWNRLITKGLVFEQLDVDRLVQLLSHTKQLHLLSEQRVSGTLTDSDLYTGYVFPLPVRQGGLVLFLANRASIDALLQLEEGTGLWILSNHELILTRSRIPVPSDALYAAERDVADKLTVQGRVYSVSWHVDPEFSITYCLLRPMDQIAGGMRSSLLGVLWFILCLAIPSLCVILLMSALYGKRIHQIRQLLSPNEAVDDFATIEMGAAMMVQRSSMLDAALTENANIQRNRLIMRLIQNGCEDKAALTCDAAVVGLDFSGSQFVVMLAGLPAEAEGDMAQWNPQRDKRVWGLELIAYKQALFLLCTDTEQTMVQLIGTLESCIRSVHHRSVIAISSTRGQPQQIPMAFLEAQSAYDSRFLMNTDRLLRFEDIGQTVHGQSYPRMFIDTLKSAIRLKDATQANQALDALMRYMQTSDLSMLGFRLLYNDIIHVLINERDGYESHQDIARMYNVLSLSRCLSIGELNSMLRDICMHLTDRQADRFNPTSMMHAVASCIREQHGDPSLSMGVIAATFHISPVALSINFKEAIGMNPSDYLTLVRMEQAKRLLTTTSQTVRDVGLAVGYIDTPGFLRKFKSYTAMTPTQYRASALIPNHPQEGE